MAPHPLALAWLEVARVLVQEEAVVAAEQMAEQMAKQLALSEADRLGLLDADSTFAAQCSTLSALPASQ